MVSFLLISLIIIAIFNILHLMEGMRKINNNDVYLSASRETQDRGTYYYNPPPLNIQLPKKPPPPIPPIK